MNWMAIFLLMLKWLAPATWMQVSAHILLSFTGETLEDPRMAAWMRANPDHPESFSSIERDLDDAEAFIDFVLYQHARFRLGLKRTCWIFTPSPPQARRSKTFEQLYRRYQACVLRLADIDH